MLIQLTSRGARIVRILLEAQGPVTVKHLSCRVKASERSIRYDFEQVEAWLKQHGLTMRRKPKVGVWVEGPREACSRALAVVGEPEGLPVVATAEERSWLILGWVLCSRLPVPVRTLAAALGVSRRTLYYDLARLRGHLRSRGLDLRWERKGISLVGDEVQCRLLIVELLERYLGNDNLVNLASMSPLGLPPGVSLQSDSVAGRWLRHVLREVGDPEAVKKISAIVSNVARAFGLRLGANLTGALVAHILVTIVRVKQGRSSRENQDQLVRLRQRPEWIVASRISRALEEAFCISLSEAEVGYIALYLASQVTETDPGSCPKLLSSQEELGLCARIIAEEAGSYLGVDLVRDVELRTGLVAHLYASIEKIRAGIPVRNPLLDEVRTRYPVIHSAARNACRRAGGVLGVNIPDEEAGWIALHIGAALERMAQRRRSWKGLVVCGSGVGVANMLKARLLIEFPNAQLKVLGAVSHEELLEWVSREGSDVVISTVELPPGPVPVVVVSPFLTTRDVRKVASVVYARGMINEADLLRACRTRIPLEVSPPQAPLEGPSLRDLVHEERIRVGVPAASPVEAIRIAGQILLENGLVSERYVEAMVNLYLRLGAYIVVAPGVALPHASPEDGAIGPGVGIITLANPLNFGSPDHDPVRAVISFASPDYTSHLRALLQLFRMLGRGIGERLGACTRAAEVVGVLCS